MSDLFPGPRVLQARRPTTLVAVFALLAASLVQAARADAKALACLGKQATIIGNSKANTLRGTKKADVIVGLGGNDRIIGGGGGDRICGGAGKDRLYGGLGNDYMNGGTGTDECLQGAGSGTKKSCEGPKFQLAVSKAGSGTGMVTSSPSAIDCGQTCASGFFEGEKVTLAAWAVEPSTFGGWGGACTGTGSCQIVMSKALSVTATFSAGPSAPGSSPAAPSCPGSPCYVVSRTGNSYQAVSPITGRAIQGNLKFVVEVAVRDLDQMATGDVIFAAEIFDLESDRFSLHDITDIEFAGAGIDATVIQNFSNADADTEPFDMHDTNRIVIRDMTVNAGGLPFPGRTTSDAIDFDGGNDVIVERVKIAQSRARGIVFDGKDFSVGVPRNADRNVVRNCVISNIPGDGIELLASSFNRIEGCTITNVGGHGIQITKASSTAMQPNKKSTDNVIVGNVIDEAGHSGISVNSSDRNTIDGNTITNSSDVASNGDGIKFTSSNEITCDDNVVRNNRATDNQTTKTQNYGLHIASANCHRTVVEPNNDFNGNRRGRIRDVASDTQYPT